MIAIDLPAELKEIAGISQEKIDRKILLLIEEGYVVTHLDVLGGVYALWGYPRDLRWFAHLEPIYALPLWGLGTSKDFVLAVNTGEPFYAPQDGIFGGQCPDHCRNLVEKYKKECFSSENRVPLIAGRWDLRSDEERQAKSDWDYFVATVDLGEF